MGREKRVEVRRTVKPETARKKSGKTKSVAAVAAVPFAARATFPLLLQPETPA
jgi:hypothetical protein